MNTHYPMRILGLLLAATLLAVTTTSCHRLSSRAKQIAGTYYIPEISEDDALMELNKNGKCTIRAVKPGVLTFSVNGYWNVKNDSLIAELNPKTLTFEGDSSLIGNVPVRISRYISDFQGNMLTLQDPSGVNVIYQRRYK